MNQITLEEHIRLHCKNAELKTELRLVKEQLAQAQANFNFLINSSRMQHFDTQQRNLATLESGPLQAHLTVPPSSLEDNSDDLLSFDDNFTTHNCSTASITPSTPMTSAGSRDGNSQDPVANLNKRNPRFRYRIYHPETSLGTESAYQTPDTNRSRSSSAHHFTDVEHRRLQGLVTFIHDEEDLDRYWRNYARSHPEHTALQWQEYFDANFRKARSETITEDDQQLIRFDHEIKSPVFVETVDSKPETVETKETQIDVEGHGQVEVVVKLPKQVEVQPEEISHRAEFCTVTISNIPKDTSLAEVLDKVTGGKILSATYLPTAGMRLKGGHTITTNGTMINFWRASAAKRFVETSNKTKLMFNDKTHDTLVTANVSFVRTQMFPIDHRLALDIVRHSMTRIFFIIGDLKPEYYVERIMSLDRTKLIRKRPLRTSRDDAGRIVLEFARIVDAVNTWNVVEWDDSVFADVQKGFLPDPCDVHGEDEFQGGKMSSAAEKDEGGDSWPTTIEKPNCQAS